MTILVHSRRDDAHASAVCWAFDRLGADYLFWPAGEFPRDQGLSASLSLEEDRHSVAFGGTRHWLGEVTTVWNRRHGHVRLRPDMDPRDRQFAADQSEQHLASFLDTLCPDALWVNRPEAANSELHKIRQLRVAKSVGMPVPPTLFSNDPDEIRTFFTRHGGEVIAKAYKLRAWTEGNRSVFVNYATPLLSEHLEDDLSLAAAPSIFQKRIDRSYEVRVTVFGREIVAVRLDVDDGTVDWRTQDRAGLKLTPYRPPVDIQSRCLAYMQRCGLAFCAFDFIVTPTGEHVFLETNQMGQFLWVEEKRPDVPMLDTMCAFLLSGSREFSRQGPEVKVRLGDYPAPGPAHPPPQPGAAAA
jgi:glutathione synthase/RimK-type ligase-like ATP-grasp enzyme